MKNAEPTVIRHIGGCQACEATWKLGDNSKMVHHGYKRPGIGSIVGDCLGVDQDPYEVSCELVKQMRASTEKSLIDLAIYKSQLDSGVITKFLVSKWGTGRTGRKLVEIDKSKVEHYAWEVELDSHTRKVDSELRQLRESVEHLTKRVADWKPMPIRTIEEQIAAEKTAKDVRDAERQAKRDATKKKDAERQAKRGQQQAQLEATIVAFSDRFKALAAKLPATTIASMEARVLAREAHKPKNQRFGGFYPDAMKCDDALVHLGLAVRVPEDKAAQWPAHVDYHAYWQWA